MTTTPTVWLPERIVATSAAPALTLNPHTISLAGGQIVTAWTDTGPGQPDWDILARIYDAEGNQVRSPFDLNVPAGDVGGSAIAALPDGGFVVAFKDGGAGIRFARYDASGVSVASGTIAAGAQNFAPSISVLDNGDYVVLYAAYQGADDWNVLARVVDGQTNSAGPAFAAAPNSDEFEYPSDVAVLTNGTIVTSNVEEDGFPYSVEVYGYDDGGNLVGGGQISGPNEVSSGSAIAALTGGGFAAVWVSSGGVRAAIYDNDFGTVAAPFTLHEADADDVLFGANVVGLRDGGFYVAWADDATDGLYGARYGATGLLIGAVTQLASGPGISAADLGLTGDGRILVSFSENNTSEIHQIILDPRDTVFVGSDASEVLVARLDGSDLSGSAGNDTLLGSAASDTLRGGADADRIEGRNGADLLEGGLERDTIYGGDGADVIYAATQSVPAGSTAGDLLYGDAGNDSVVGSLGADTMLGGAGSDTMDGGALNDNMAGGADSDFYVVDDIADKVIEAANQGYDTVHTTLASYTLGANVERLYFDDGGAHVGRGNGLANRLYGNAGDDRFVVDAGGGDTFSGGYGTDVFDGRSATTGMVLRLDDQSLNAGAVAGDLFGSVERFTGSNSAGDSMTMGLTGRAYFLGNGGNDTLTGGSNVDALFGGDGADRLFGNAGKDALIGGTGDDTMTGGSERDTFQFAEANFGQDSITDFQDGLDLLKFQSAVADDVGDFAITDNGTTHVVLTLSPGNTITLDGAENITVTSKDFLFY